jgi:two-component system nitrate/nitrite response regulator NarL
MLLPLPAMRGGRMLARLGDMGFSVLLVDDSAPFLDAARTLLEREGLEVLDVASNSAEALGRVEQLRPDLVLVDINLGAESGFDLARRLLDDAENQRPTVILMSTHAAADFAELLAESPASGFLPKSELSADAIRLILDGGVEPA